MQIHRLTPDLLNQKLWGSALCGYQASPVILMLSSRPTAFSQCLQESEQRNPCPEQGGEAGALTALAGQASW